jgi:uncharacterized protein YukE
MDEENDDFQWEVEDEAVDSKPEIEVEDDTPEADRGREPMPKEIVDELEADELEEYSEKVKLRLKQMKKVWHDERREKERYQREQNEALSAAQRYRQEAEQLRQTLAHGQESLVGSVRQNVEFELSEARRAYREAYEAGDTDKVLDAQEKLHTAQYKLEQLANYKPALQPQETEVQITPEAVQIPRPDQKTMAWQERNQWYGLDEEMTAAALGLDQKLKKQYGNDYIGTDEYWNAIDTTMRRRFPEYFGDSEPASSDTKPAARTNKSAVVASASRSTSSKKIVLRQSQLAIAKKLGLTPEQYAREVAKEK